MKWKELRKKLGDHLKDMMVTKGYSTRDMVAKTRLSKQAIDRLQNGETDPRLKTLLKYADGIGVTIKELFEPLMTDAIVTEHDQLLDAARQLLRNPKTAETFRDIIRGLNKPR